ncbi:DUF4296 domain-containing protein [Croceitalea sp. MTPC9]|uniref:DUF4296 domain-containing protein n=1 Tax=unclassified Croceitalea TaxID=2632280 RepID=UPI002B37ECAC|nr:DUF4296 domain-containing protein [Croceitalea sp. MTPC6]GMN16954.1 DUF4296 domain-containing protein [Croceitalea sp. MTPC9]
MRLAITFLCLFLLLASCGEKVIEPPENLVSKEKMAAILYDLAILNSTKGTNPTILKKNSIEVMPFIFEKHGIDSTQFAESDLYYASIPLEYQNIYESVEARLESEVKFLEDEKKRKNDSISNASKKRRDSLNNKIKLPINDSLPKK